MIELCPWPCTNNCAACQTISINSELGKFPDPKSKLYRLCFECLQTY